ncbi:MAG: hypothetical protein WCK58_08060 [Chloroflexota bacterium]
MRLLVRLLGLVVVLAVIVVVLAAFAGVAKVPVLTGFFGNDKPRDLGEAAPDQAGFDALVAGYGIKMPSPAQNYTFASPHSFSGSVKVDATFTEGQIMALKEMGNPAPGISDVHMRFHAGSAEVAAMVDLSAWGYPASGPVWATWTLDVTGPTSVEVAITQLEFGKIPVPGDLATQASDALNNYLASRLPQVDGLEIGTFELVEGGVHFSGSLPQTYEASAPVPGGLP